MTDAQDLFNHLAARYGGVAALSPIDTEILAAIVKSMTTLQAADPAATPKIAAAIEKLTAQLPGAAAGGCADLSKLSGDQYDCIRRADRIHSGEEPPGPPEPFDASNMSDARARLLKRLEEIAERIDRLDELDESDPLAPVPGSTRRRVREELERAIADIAKLQAENKAAAELIDALEARLALEYPP
jgi:hypothetical protein